MKECDYRLVESIRTSPMFWFVFGSIMLGLLLRLVWPTPAVCGYAVAYYSMLSIWCAGAVVFRTGLLRRPWCALLIGVLYVACQLAHDPDVRILWRVFWKAEIRAAYGATGGPHEQSTGEANRAESGMLEDGSLRMDLG